LLPMPPSPLVIRSTMNSKTGDKVLTQFPDRSSVRELQLSFGVAAQPV
jgi:hypothetical protein